MNDRNLNKSDNGGNTVTVWDNIQPTSEDRSEERNECDENTANNKKNDDSSNWSYNKPIWQRLVTHYLAKSSRNGESVKWNLVSRVSNW